MSRDRPRLREGPLNIVEWLAAPVPPHCGAVTSFVGTVRNQHESRAVTGIRYHAYAPLAEARLREIEAEAAAKFDAQVTVAHATGELIVGDASVIVIACAGHRAEAFAACRWAIDTIKQAVPIWKEERYAAGDSRFLEGQPIREVKAP
jgi:molybdopterin synthase catalytic subunit